VQRQKSLLSGYNLNYFLEADRIALRRPPQPPWRTLLGRDPIWKFQVLLRLTEFYYSLSRPTLVQRVTRKALQYWLTSMKERLGFTIPLYVFGPGLSIAHYGTIVVNENARIGANCRIHVDVNIGTAAGTSDEAPVLGNNIYIGPGVKMYGKIEVADGTAIGANSVVNRSFLEGNISLGGIPAKKISDKGSLGLLVSATELLNSGESLGQT
jgi:serine O-acetyltransferase